MNNKQKLFHQSRREEFARLIGKDSIAVIFGNTHKNKSYDGDYQFKQYKNFYYLSGFTEANAALLMAPGGISIEFNGKIKTVTEVLYVQKKDPLMETWNGRRTGYKDAGKVSGIKNALENTELAKALTVNGLKKFSKLYTNIGEVIKLSEEMQQIISPFINQLNRIASGIEITDVSYLLGKMRSVKTDFEIDLLQRAADITAKSFNDTMKKIKPGLFEYQIQANLEYQYKYNGSEEIAYYPIVAGGENACILHYDSNNQELKPGELLLIDSGAEYNYYCSDITRTFPVNGKFTNEQKIIYNIVLKANEECIKKIKPGVKLSFLRDLSERVLAEGLRKAGLLRDKKNIKKYSLHGVGHHIGLDTHDAVAYSKTLTSDSDTLVEGNVVTIEPGLYFTKEMKEIPQKFRGMGVRIEDDVLVTGKGYRNLTKGVEKEVREIERMMGSTD